MLPFDSWFKLKMARNRNRSRNKEQPAASAEKPRWFTWSSVWKVASGLGLATILAALLAYEQHREATLRHALQSLSTVEVRRHEHEGKWLSELRVCGTSEAMQSVTGFQALWLSSFGRYKMPNPTAPYSTIDVVMRHSEDERGWISEKIDERHCASREEPHWAPILKFINDHRAAHTGFVYWHSSETLLIVYQRDFVGEEHPRYFLFPHQPAPEMISAKEAKRWIAKYRKALDKDRIMVIPGGDSDISGISSYFP